MLIGDKYKVESDSLGVTLYKKRRSRKTGIIRWQPVAYFATIGNLLKYMINLEVNETGFTDLIIINKKLDELMGVVEKFRMPQKTLQRVRRMPKGCG